MVTTPEEYFGKLHLSLNSNPPALALLPNVENIYNIDAQSRIIDAPKFLGVERDHKAETIYFVIDKFVGYMDMTQTCCIITYINETTQETRAYIVPFYDVTTFADEGKMLVPWCLDATALKAAGTVKFSLNFYKIGEKVNEKNGEVQKIITYSFNTLPAKSTVLPGMENKKYQSSDDILTNDYQDLVNRINDIASYQQVYWTIL